MSALHIETVGNPAVPFKALEQQVRRWQQQYPESPTSHIAMSELYLELAWAYRGSGSAATVRKEAWEPFYKNVALARQNLEAHKAIAAVDPRWYEAMLIVARAQGWGRDEFYRLLEEALQREPCFYQTYFAAIQYLLPKWHGDAREIEAFARWAVDRTAQLEGEGMYARIYWYASQAQFRLKLFERSEVVWPRMKQGFDDVVAKYPDTWNLSNYARFACLARDKETTREVMERIPSEALAEIWQPIQVWQGCWDWSHAGH
ncbi:DUF4034 domain-containing protein [Steroidobacter flavus]|uniref:DUF4034 domain-containing protein n=1 Tax=Steroidobacter flavus TaxID=1842136 RepID=A0ABV8T7V7_9GAMM